LTPPSKDLARLKIAAATPLHRLVAHPGPDVNRDGDALATGYFLAFKSLMALSLRFHFLWRVLATAN
jgi:hypothetical protein